MGGITLRVSVPSTLAQGLGGEGEEVRLYTQLLLKDDDPRLYGFPTPDARRFFQMLTTVSGIGPRTALNLLSALAPETLASAILTGDLDAFTGIPNIGKKSAARIVLELRGKLEGDEMLVGAIGDGADGDAVSALTALGYTAAEARQALTSLGDVAGLELEERLRMALAHLSRLP